jgi:hypothetical protein
MLGVASACVADEIGKICSQTSPNVVALQPRSVKDPASAFSHNQDPKEKLTVFTWCAASILSADCVSSAALHKVTGYSYCPLDRAVCHRQSA